VRRAGRGDRLGSLAGLTGAGWLSHRYSRLAALQSWETLLKAMDAEVLRELAAPRPARRTQHPRTQQVDGSQNLPLAPSKPVSGGWC